MNPLRHGGLGLAGLAWAFGFALLVSLSGCQGSDSEYKTAAQLKQERPPEKEPAHADHDHDHGHEGHDHEHSAPHGGELVELGEHASHLEIVLDPAAGKLTAYTLDGHAEKPVDIEQKEIVLTITPETDDAKPESIELKLVPEGTGEKASVFAAIHEKLKGAEHLDIKIAEITVNGKSFKDLNVHCHPAEPKTEAPAK